MKKNATGLQNSLIEYIENISFGEENIFNSEGHLVSFIDCIFRTNSIIPDNVSETSFNRYFLLSDMLKGTDTRLPTLKEREKKESELFRLMRNNRKATYKNYANDILTFNMSDEFRSEYAELGTPEKCLICHMLLSHGLTMFAEYIKSNKGRETSLCLVLHADESEFHIHRLYGRTE